MQLIVRPFDLRKLDPATMPPGDWKIFVSSDAALGGLPCQVRIYESDVLVSSFGLAGDFETVQLADEALLRTMTDWFAKRRARLASTG